MNCSTQLVKLKAMPWCLPDLDSMDGGAPRKLLHTDACCDNMAQTDLKGLSGGERSFSTLAFTLALENVISVPFCCLDEFDVVRLVACQRDLTNWLNAPVRQRPDRQSGAHMVPAQDLATLCRVQFMDAMNRTLGLQLLIEMAVENQSLQLILLSPQVPQA